MPQSARWQVITDYPRNRSPYFGALDRAAGEVGLPIAFAPELPAPDSEPGVVNLHRLKRLYRGATGERDRETLERFFAQLDALRANGFRVVWTLHNLYPIDGSAVDACDELATAGILQRVDAILCHTAADAANIRALAPADVRIAVSGWAGLPSGDGIGASVAALLEQIPRDRPVFLVLGNDAPYKEVRRVCDAFLAATRRGHLVVAGPVKRGSRQSAVGSGQESPPAHEGGALKPRSAFHSSPADCLLPTADSLDDTRTRSDERLLFWNHRVEPSEAHHLLGRASWAVCHYASRGRYEYFQRFLFPSSVSAAVCAGTPVLAPDLASVREISAGHTRILYEDDDRGMAAAFAEADEREAQPSPVAAPSATWARWQQMLTVYRQVFDDLCGSRSTV
jgi:glycosyltransferase involved in cell wall biosynthesis